MDRVKLRKAEREDASAILAFIERLAEYEKLSHERVATEEELARVEWWVLDWYEPSIKFYESIGAKPMSDWTVYRMDGEAIQSFVGD